MLSGGTEVVVRRESGKSSLCEWLPFRTNDSVGFV